MSREFLITGGAGFIGSQIQDRIIELGGHVSIVDNLRKRIIKMAAKNRFYRRHS